MLTNISNVNIVNVLFFDIGGGRFALRRRHKLGASRRLGSTRARLVVTDGWLFLPV